jgi:hypothetical protein
MAVNDDRLRDAAGAVMADVLHAKLTGVILCGEDDVGRRVWYSIGELPVWYSTGETPVTRPEVEETVAEKIVAALAAVHCPLRGWDLAEAAGCEYNSRFRAEVADLLKRRAIGRTKEGYIAA